MPKKQSSDSLSRLAARVLAGGKATQADARRLAASVLSQDETRGRRRQRASRRAAGYR